MRRRLNEHNSNRQKSTSRKNGKWIDIVKDYIKPQTFDWKNELRYYNCHIGLRRYDAYAPHKPFTKGFTAAAFRCPIVVDSFNVDAQYYLPSDYPLFSPIPGPVDTKEKIREVHSFVQSKYHTPEWDYAVECMENLYRKCNSKKVTQRWKTVFEKIENLL